MNAIILTIGDEILIGQIIDTNSAWIAENLNLLGIKVLESRSISDNHLEIISHLTQLQGKTDLVLITGGLGPTRDDITKNSLNEFFGGKMVENAEVLKNIEEIFHIRGFELTPVNRLQASIPDNCIPLRNPAGTAPGMWFEKGGTIFISMPGVPFEMKGIMENEVLPRLGKMNRGQVLLHRTLMTQGIPESYLASLISSWEDQLPVHIKLAYLPRPGIVRLRLTGTGTDFRKLEEELQNEISKVLKIIPEDIFAFSDTGLEEAIGMLLREKKLRLSVAESCTGGMISSLLTSVSGASEYFNGSVIAYSNEMKISLLGVKAESIVQYGAVSEAVVKEMAEGVRKLSKADYGIATSGIAGPGGGSKEKPIGTTWIAVSSSKNCIARHFNFGEHRGRNMERASLTALNLLRKNILGYKI